MSCGYLPGHVPHDKVPFHPSHLSMALPDCTVLSTDHSWLTALLQLLHVPFVFIVLLPPASDRPA